MSALTEGQSPVLNLGQCTVPRVFPGPEWCSGETNMTDATILVLTLWELLVPWPSSWKKVGIAFLAIVPGG